MLHLADGEEIVVDVILWAGSHRGAVDGLLPGHSTRVVVNSKLQVRPFTNIFALGDVANLPVVHRKPSVEETLQEAAYIANIIPLLAQNKHILPFVPKPTQEIIPLGTKTALYVYKHIARISPFYADRYLVAHKKYLKGL